MISQSRAVLRYLFLDLIGSVIYFPAWWYGAGFVDLVRRLWQNLSFQAESFGLRIWIKYLFVPMYGQYDWTSRLLSFVVRLVVLLVRLVMLLVLAILDVGLMICWLAAPIVFLLLFAQGVYQGTFMQQASAVWP